MLTVHAKDQATAKKLQDAFGPWLTDSVQGLSTRISLRFCCAGPLRSVMNVI
jgi:hypothetical protein